MLDCVRYEAPWPGWLRWAWMLPALELILAAVVAGPPAFRALRNPPPLFRAPDGRIVIDMRIPAARPWAELDMAKRFPSRFEDVFYLNMPASLVEIGISLPTSWPESYRPGWAWPLGLYGFRAITWPIWALPFWFFAGRGIDSVFRGKHILRSRQSSWVPSVFSGGALQSRLGGIPARSAKFICDGWRCRESCGLAFLLFV